MTAATSSTDTNNETSIIRRVSRSTRRRPSSSDLPSEPGKRILVDHTYYDHLQDPKRVSSSTSKRQSVPRGGVTVAFPERLHQMLTRVDEEELNEIVSWQSHGRCFLVHRKKEFIEQVMPRFFHQTKLTSFQRQLNLYGFVRLTAGRDRGAYYHQLFLRGRPDLCRGMIRTRVKGNGMKAASNPLSEPNFYEMPYCPASIAIPKEDNDIDDVSMEDVGHHHHHDEQQAESSYSSEELPVVTPLTSPVQPLRRRMFRPPVTISFLELPDPMADPCSNPAVLSIVSDDPALHTGDEVFFEGLKFRYLDQVDFSQEDDMLNPFIDQVDNVEYV